ncbi:antibiotic biosynthesis monooxygenase [Brevibacterium sp. BRM-1]|uniref:antibiotic biosynthesis monooxygenase n=1 Tax=Brevibacterium sp. BRM-1 TaxID=2999062 RepID=UPI00228177DD|nr:antibiotic biosynthesis monooxygenase [Brevibacterium sp. BRM-1]WAL40096.1 antibiotic biosynthesis monooxygenase [Brevibacterium sp. BRM-1]
MSDSVTVQITREVEPAAESEVERWVARGQALLTGREGYMGSGWVRARADSHTWHMLYRFADHASMRQWEESAERRAWAAELADFVHSERAERRTGIEGWFDTEPFAEQAPGDPAPPRWKQMIVIFTGFFPMSYLGNLAVGALVPHTWPLILRVLLTIMLVMPFMVYFILPWTTRLYQPWLARPRRARSNSDGSDRDAGGTGPAHG